MVECGTYFVTDPRGFSEVARFIGKDFLSVPGVLRLNTAVTGVDFTSGKVTLVDGSTVVGFNVITTFSAGVVNHAIDSGSLFNPPLPQKKIDAFSMVNMGTYMKLFLQFPFIVRTLSAGWVSRMLSTNSRTHRMFHLCSSGTAVATTPSCATLKRRVAFSRFGKIWSATTMHCFLHARVSSW